MIKSMLVALALLIGMLGFVHTADADGGPRTRIRLEARMRAAGVEAKVSYREEVRGSSVRRTVQAEISRALPNTTYDVYHQGVRIGSVTTNALGVGRAEWSRNVPAMTAGQTAGVGTLTGRLVARP